MKTLITTISILLSLAGKAQVPMSYFGNHVLGPTETNLGGIGISTAWPPWNPSAIRLWDNYAHNGSPTFTYGSITWRSINTANGVYDWVRFDKILLKYKAQGVTDLIYTLGYAPQWAGGGVNGDSAVTNQTYIATFLTAVANRAISLDIPIKHWEIWNEPNNGSGSYKGSINQMVTIAQTVYNTVKAVNSSYQVLSPASQGYSTTTTVYDPSVANTSSTVSTRWFATFLSAGGGAYCDVLGFHGYIGSVFENISTLVDTYKSIATTYSQSAKPIWNTEANSISSGYIPTQQARFLAVTYLLQWVKGVSRFYWYTWDSDTDGRQWIYDGGGIDSTGTANLQVINWMVDATVDNLTVVGTVYSVRITRGSLVSHAVWNSAGSSTYTTSHTQYSNLFGTQGSVSGSLTINQFPVLLTDPYSCP